jgi:ABC-2 type transport system permease protein
LNKTILYDFRRTLLSKALIISIVAVMSLGIAVLAADASANESIISSSNKDSVNDNTLTLFLHQGNDSNFLSYSFNQFGQPLSGVRLEVNITKDQTVYHSMVTSNASGYSIATFVATSIVNGTATIEIIYPDGSISSGGTMKIEGIPRGAVTLIKDYPPIALVSAQENTRQKSVLVFFAGPNASLPTGYLVYYKFAGLDQSDASFFNMTSMLPLGVLKQYHETFRPIIPANQSSSSILHIVVFYPNGTEIFALSTPLELFFPQSQVVPFIKIASDSFQGVIAFLVAFISVIASFVLFGKEKLSGVIDSVLVLPISRRELIMSRYFSIFFAVGTSTLIVVTVEDFAVWFLSGNFLPSLLVIGSLGAFATEICSILSISFILAYFIRSSTFLAFGSVIIWVFFLQLLWNPLISTVASLLGAAPLSQTYIRVAIVSYFVNPTHLVSLIYILNTGDFEFTPIFAPSFGVSIMSIIVAEILWTLIPLLSLLYIAKRKD